MIREVATHFVAFGFGVLTAYYADKYTDRRREGEAERKEKREFAKIVRQMPELIAEMKKDLSEPECQRVREFFLSRREYVLNSSGNCFIYYENDHGDLRGAVHILENCGYLRDVTPGNAPKYRMTEHFVRLVRNAEPPDRQPQGLIIRLRAMIARGRRK